VLASAAPVASDQPIRVMFVQPSLSVGGAERHITHLVRLLPREQFSCTVCCIKEPGPLAADVEAAGVEVIALESGTRQAGSALARLTGHMRRVRPHVVTMNGFNAEVLGRAAATAARVPARVVWKHNCGDLHRRLRVRIMDRLLDRATDYYFGVAFGQVPYLVNDLGLRGDKIRIIRNGVDPQAYSSPGEERRREVAASLGIEEGDRVVGILAVLRPEKDHATFLRAGRRVLDRMPRARLLVVGDGPRREDSERLAAELGLGDRVIFAGMRSDIADVLSVVDVIVLSSFTIECFPFSVLEAMSASVPAVCTAIGGLPELVEDGVTGHLVPPRDPAGLAEGILRVIEPPGRAEEMGAAARRRLEERFTLQRCVDETGRTLTSIVAASRR
jgi:glycosyltransferase involved in cell wall biosynthesis